MKVGDKVRLKNYERYFDYIAHEGQEATITEIGVLPNAANNNLTIKVVWLNGSYSAVSGDNVVVVEEECSIES